MAATTAGTSLSGLARSLVQQGRLSQTDVESLQEEANSAGLNLVTHLIKSRKLTGLEIAEFASETLGLPLFDLDALETTLIPISLINTKLMQTYRILPLQERNNRIALGISDPTNLKALDDIKFQTGFSVDPIVVEDDKLNALLSQFVEPSDPETATAETDLGEFAEETDEDKDSAAAAAMAAEVDDAPVVKYIQKILLDAINTGASDIHFEPYEKFYRIRYRTDGVLYNVAQPPLALKEKIASRIKVISRLDISEKRVPQDGRMKLVLSKSRAIDFRVSSLPTLFGEKIVMRILDPSSATLGIDALGYEPDQKENLLHAINRPYGMILVTGPTGSGKTVPSTPASTF
jgi:type IV pilus assembly protein PilB